MDDFRAANPRAGPRLQLRWLVEVAHRMRVQDLDTASKDDS